MGIDAQIAATWEEIGSLTPWDQNPRHNATAVDSVAASIERFGFGSPIIARESDRVVIAGHTRLKAAQKLGLDKVPVRFLDLDPAQARALALADNRIGEIAEWDDDMLSRVLAELNEEIDLDGLGWSDDEIQALLDDTDPIENEDPDYDPGSVFDRDPDSKSGEIYDLGPHRLICGDCRDPEIVAQLMQEQRINVAFTSPPYASQRKYDESSGFKPIHPDAYVEWFEAVQANVRTHLADDGSWFVNIKEHCDDGQRSLYVKDLTIAHVRSWNWRFIDEFCWRRVGLPGLFGPRFKNEFEPVFYFCTGVPAFYPDNVREPRDETTKCYQPDSLNIRQGNSSKFRKVKRTYDSALPGNVIDLAKGSNAGKGHSAAFPVALPAFFIKAFSDPSDIIFDPFLGSGSTLIAAAQEKRICFGVEISPAYCDVIRRRWTAFALKNKIDPGSGALDPICEEE